MPLPKKARIQEGYPKLALVKQLPQIHRLYYPTRHQGWPSLGYSFNIGELLVILADSWRNDYKYFVPFKLLADERIPLTSVLTWTKSYKTFPQIYDDHIEIINGTPLTALNPLL